MGEQEIKRLKDQRSEILRTKPGRSNMLTNQIFPPKLSEVIGIW